MVSSASIERTRRIRLGELIAYARANSPYYHELYEGLPDHVDDVSLLPVTNKKSMMARFDDWATDREVTRDKVEAFLADPTLIGKPFLGKYRVSQTSGATGTRLTFVSDENAEAATEAVAKQMMLSWLGWFGALSMLVRSQVLRKDRTASVIATGGHTSAFSRVSMNADRNPGEKRRVFSVHSPIPELVSGLNEYKPDVLQGYASTLALLADEERAGRLHIRPAFVLPMSEGLLDRQYDEIAKAFKAKIGIAYGGTECGGVVAWSCKYRWLHLNSDWAIVEPVDSDFRPVAPGVQSHTALVSNLANRVLPVLRYDMGDSILVRPDPCPCGNPMPAIHILGRVADVLTFPSSDGGSKVRITSLQLGTVIDSVPGVQLFQVVQTAPDTLRVRLRMMEGTDANQVWQSVHSRMSELLAKSGLGNVLVERAGEAPDQTPGGKYREVIPLNR